MSATSPGRVASQSRPAKASEMVVRSVSSDGVVVLGFYGGSTLVVDVSPELAHFYRRLVTAGDA
jgi:hypothetical protein